MRYIMQVQKDKIIYFILDFEYDQWMKWMNEIHVLSLIKTQFYYSYYSDKQI